MTRTLTVEQVAAMLHVKPMTVREYLRRGRIPGRRLGKRWLILEADLERSLGLQNTGPEEDVPAHVSEWRALSPEERRRRLDEVMGRFATANWSVEDFMKEKHEEVEAEERRRQERPGGRP